MKTALTILFGLVACSFIATSALNVAAGKNFWLDERNTIINIYSATTSDLLSHGTSVQYSGSPLSFLLEKPLVKYILLKEKVEGQGFDWRVSLRVFSAVSLALCTFIAFLLLLKVNLPMALTTPMFMGIFNFALYYGAETRPYSFWLGLSLIFYVITLIFIFNPRSRIWSALWTLSALLLPCTIITSPAQVFVAGTLLLLLNQMWKWRSKTVLISVLTALVGSVLIMKYFNSYPLGERKIVLPQFAHFLEYGLMPLEGPKKTFKVFCAGLLLLLAGIYGKQLGNRKLYFALGALGLSQLIVLPAIYLAQYLAGSYFAQRHGIFAVACRVLIDAGMVALLCDVAFLVAKYLKAKPIRVLAGYTERRLQFIGMSIVLLAVSWDWVHWRVICQPKNIETILSKRGPFCAGPAIIPVPPEMKSETPEERELVEEYKFDRLNVLRHSQGCVKSDIQNKNLYDYWPEWIYGPHDQKSL